MYSNSLTRTRICGTPRLSIPPASHLPLQHPNASQPPSFLHGPAQFLSHACPFFSFVCGLRAYLPSFSRVHEYIAPSLSNRPRSVPLSQTSFRYNSLLLERHGRPRAARLTVARISASLGRPHTTSAGQQIPRPSNYPRAEFRPLVFRFKCPCAGFFRGATARATALSFPLFLCPLFSACLFSSLSLSHSRLFWRRTPVENR